MSSRFTPPLLTLLTALLLSLLAVGCGGGGSSNAGRRFPLSSLGRSTVTVNGKSLRVWVMDTPEKRAEGMMYLRSEEVAEDEGMLFVYPAASYLSYYMRNTAIPLDIAFLDAAGSVVSASPLQPFDETPVNSAAPAQFALEVKQRTLARLGVTTGTSVQIPSNLAGASRAAPVRPHR